MRAGLAVVFYASLGWGPAWAVCAGQPYDELDFWLGEWHTRPHLRPSITRSGASPAAA